MRKLVVFNNVTLDGYFTGADGDFRWAHEGSDDAEYGSFVAENARGGGELLFGRITYELMAAYWPTARAMSNDPNVAERMNKMPKIVFSRSLGEASWSNTTLIRGDLVSEVRRIKNAPGEGIAILGSGRIVAQLAPHGLIDEFQLVVNPVILGSGRTMFEGVKTRLNLKLASLPRRQGILVLCAGNVSGTPHEAIVDAKDHLLADYLEAELIVERDVLVDVGLEEGG